MAGEGCRISSDRLSDFVYLESIMRILHKIQLALFAYGKLVSGERHQVFLTPYFDKNLRGRANEEYYRRIILR